MIHFCILTHGEEEVFRLLDGLAGQSIYVVDDMSHGGFCDRVRWKCTKFFQRRLDKDFASQRNFIHQEVPVGEWICWLDSDEEIFSSALIPTLNNAIKTGCDSISICRINTVFQDGKMIQLTKERHRRVYVNNGVMRWENKLHEGLTGFRDCFDPDDDTVLVNHCKTSERCQAQDAFYQTFK